MLGEMVAGLARARVLLSEEGPGARAEIEATLARVLELARGAGAKVYEEPAHVELANLAFVCGEEASMEEELGEARRLGAEMGIADEAVEARLLAAGA